MKLLPIKNTCLTLEEVSLILKARFTTVRLDKIRDIFLFSCFTGLNYSDIKNLTTKNLVVTPKGKYWIKIYIQKSSVPMNIPLLDIPRIILEKYSEYSNSTGYCCLYPAFKR